MALASDAFYRDRKQVLQSLKELLKASEEDSVGPTCVYAEIRLNVGIMSYMMEDFIDRVS